MLMLQWLGSGFGNMMAQLEAIGFFQYVLPFLLIFAFSYALLTQIKIFEGNKGSAAIIAFAIGFLALQLNFVPLFFANIFPRFGIGLAILLVALILSGIFISEEYKTAYTWIFFGIGMLIFIIIAISSLSSYSVGLTGFWYQYGAMIIVGALIIGAIVAIFVSQRKPGAGGNAGS